MKRMIAGIIMGSDSDFYVMEEVAQVFIGIGIEFEIEIVSAHRTPDKMYEYAKTAKERGVAVIIAGAGGSAHLPGMVAALTCIPVIGVPIKTKSLDGIDSLLSIIQMPTGVPVATVSINGGTAAGWLAARMIGVNQSKIKQKLTDHMQQMIETGESESWIDNVYNSN